MEAESVPVGGKGAGLQGCLGERQPVRDVRLERHARALRPKARSDGRYRPPPPGDHAIAEAIAAGKLVITDPGTAEPFGEAVVASDGSDVDAIVREHVREPRRYREFVERAQASMERFRPAAVAARLLRNLVRPGGLDAAL